MSSKALAARYSQVTARPPSNAGAGDLFSPIQGLDLFGIKRKRQEEALARYEDYLQRQGEGELEDYQKKSDIDKAKQETLLKETTDAAKERDRFNAAVDIVKQKGIIPSDENIKSYNDMTVQQRLEVAKIENQIDLSQRAAQLKATQGKEGQDAINAGTIATLGLPAIQAQALSRWNVAPGEASQQLPLGNVSARPETAYGGSLTSTEYETKYNPITKQNESIPTRVQTATPGRFPGIKVDLPPSAGVSARPSTPAQQPTYNPALTASQMFAKPPVDSNAALQSNQGTMNGPMPYSGEAGFQSIQDLMTNLLKFLPQFYPGLQPVK